MKSIFSKIVVFSLVLTLALPAEAQHGKTKRKKAKVSNTDSLMGRILMQETFDFISQNYVEEPDLNAAAEHGIVSMLNHMDPHSAFIPQRNVESNNESLVGNFEGVGIRFSIDHDTIIVNDVVVGGPAEKVGLLLGDKIVSIDGENATGDTITNTFVFKRLRGKKDTKVVLTIRRPGVRDLMDFTVVRGKVPLYSVESTFMLDSVTGYVRLTRFARTSVTEVQKAINDLKKEGMKRLVFDLRGNGGGYLDIAFNIADQFLPSNKLIVYQEGRRQPRQNFRSTFRGCFTDGDLVVLIDENSASASEIVSGALQDWDRAVIVGRRSFGKGLVQRQFKMNDGSELRLTTARYYTPSGRCIQKPYDKGLENYYREISQRYSSGELVHADSIHFPDSLKYRTSQGRTVYGGGGIMPDIFVPIDTVRLSDYFLTLRSKGLFTEFCNDFASAHRLDTTLATFDQYLSRYDSLRIDSLFSAFASSKGVQSSAVRGDWVAGWVADQFKKQLKDTAAAINAQSYVDYIAQWRNDDTFMTALQEKAQKEDIRAQVINQKSEEYLHCLLKALIAQNLYGPNYYYRIMKDQDEGLRAAFHAFDSQVLGGMK